ncbi:MAG: hypothetical protein M3R08_07030 [Bacteroidota bacterium]|nr:hypothetical protein [Bacteroidota bacterium]
MWDDIANKTRMALYGLMAILGFTQVLTTFSLLMAFQMEVIVLVLLYKCRPQYAILRNHPDSNVILIGMIPFVVSFYFIIILVSDQSFNKSFLEPLKKEMHLLLPILVIQVFAAIMDRSVFMNDERIWTDLPSKIIRKVITVWILSLVGVVVLYFRESSMSMLLPFLMLVRMILEISPILGQPEKSSH